MATKQKPPPEVFLKRGTTVCPNEVCHAPLNFEVLGSMRVKNEHEDGRYYYNAVCSWGRCGQRVKVSAPTEPKYVEPKTRPTKLAVRDTTIEEARTRVACLDAVKAILEGKPFQNHKPLVKGILQEVERTRKLQESVVSILRVNEK